jgi:hypothetical protein
VKGFDVYYVNIRAYTGRTMEDVRWRAGKLLSIGYHLKCFLGPSARLAKTEGGGWLVLAGINISLTVAPPRHACTASLTHRLTPT